MKAEGLQPQQYNQVIQLAQVDKAFERKFLHYVNEVKNSPSWAQEYWNQSWKLDGDTRSFTQHRDIEQRYSWFAASSVL